MFWQFEWHYNKDRMKKNTYVLYSTYAQYHTSVCFLFLQLDEFYTSFFELLFVRHGTVLVRYIKRYKYHGMFHKVEKKKIIKVSENQDYHHQLIIIESFFLVSNTGSNTVKKQFWKQSSCELLWRKSKEKRVSNTLII